MRRFVAFLFVLVATFVALAIFVDVEPLLRDRSMRAPADACPRLDLGPRQCQAVVAHAIDLAEVDEAEVVKVELGAVEERMTLGGPRIAQSRLHLVDGRIIDREIGCPVGSDHLAWCTEDPRIQLWLGANHDVPCPGASDQPDACATPIVLDPAAVAAAEPLRIGALDVPATVGHHEIKLGRATLANGFLNEARFGLVDPAPDGILIPTGIRLDVRPVDPSRPPFSNVYERGVVAGVEEASVWLVFDVVAAPDGAVLQVRDVLVD